MLYAVSLERYNNEKNIRVARGDSQEYLKFLECSPNLPGAPQLSVAQLQALTNCFKGPIIRIVFERGEVGGENTHKK